MDRYEEALAKARAGKSLEEIFPEMKESEDERIRKELIQYLRDYPSLLPRGFYSRDDFFSYLEKLKSTERSEDAMVRKALISLIYENSHTYKSFAGIDLDSMIAYLEKQKVSKPVHFELKAGSWYICHRAYCCRADSLTVKEGERFQCEKDGVVKGFVIKEPEKYFTECSAPAPMEDEQKEQKPVESCDDLCCGDDRFKIIEEARKDIIEKTNIAENELSMEFPLLDGILMRVWQVGWLNKKQKPAEWSEEDKAMLKVAIAVLRRYSHDDVANWLKSLRPHQYCENCKLKRSVENWKPSNEQMNALYDIIHPADPVNMDAVKSLYNDLKAL